MECGIYQVHDDDVDKRLGRAPTDDDNTITTASQSEEKKNHCNDYYRIPR